MRGYLNRFAVGLLAGSMLVLPALAEPEVVVLGGGGGDDVVAACGDLAASPFEAGRDGRGLSDEQVFIDGATAACENALAANPDSAEVMTWLARAYVLAGRRDAARPLLEDASAAGNVFATYLLANLVGKTLDRTVPEDPERAVLLLIAASDAGFAPAQADLGDRYERGDGVDQSFPEALRLYQSASEGGVGMASYKAGSFFAHANGIDLDFGRATDFYNRAVAQGEPRGNYGLGEMYEFAIGVQQDYAKAAEYYQLAADAGDMMAQTSLAYLYGQGLGVAQDYSKSFALLVDAAAQNYGLAQAALSLAYMFGEGTEIDLAKAFDLAWAAQRAGVVYAEGILGYIYEEGLGVGRDLPNALFHYQAGADQGDQYSAGQLPNVETQMACLDAAGAPSEPGVIPGVSFEAIDPAVAIPACEAAVNVNSNIGNRVWLARAYVKDGAFDDAIPILEEGVGAGNVLAHVVLGDMLLNGTGIDADPARAIELYRAVASDFGLAQYALGIAYAYGNGVAEDRVEAIKWLRMAELYGVAQASEQIAALQNDSDPGAVDLSGFGREGPGY